MSFDHFSIELFGFLEELTVNNNRDWFNANKARYEESVREPARAFVREMGQRLNNLAPNLIASDKKVGGSLMRVYRDTRFSKDKTPYKTNVGIQFRHNAGKDVHAPGLYLHLALDSVFIGTGVWMPPNPVLNEIRGAIDARPERWRAIISDPKFSANFEQRGESLKRPPKGFAKDHPLVAELKRKSFIAISELSIEDVTTSGMVDRFCDRFSLASDYTRFICEAVGQSLD